MRRSRAPLSDRRSFLKAAAGASFGLPYLVGADVPAGLDGKSLRPVIERQASGVRDTLFLAYKDVQRAVRDGRWKLIRYPQVNMTQLFDLQNDPDEIVNLAASPDHAERVASLTRELARWQRELGDRAPLVVDSPRPATWDPTKIPSRPAKGTKRKKGS
jgi:arylsulfatase A-like enzyme